MSQKNGRSFPALRPPCWAVRAVAARCATGGRDPRGASQSHMGRGRLARSWETPREDPENIDFRPGQPFAPTSAHVTQPPAVPRSPWPCACWPLPLLPALRPRRFLPLMSPTILRGTPFFLPRSFSEGGLTVDASATGGRSAGFRLTAYFSPLFPHLSGGALTDGFILLTQIPGLPASTLTLAFSAGIVTFAADFGVLVDFEVVSDPTPASLRLEAFAGTTNWGV